MTMTRINFKKMHGLGNDFVVIDNRTARRKLTNGQVAFLCDRKIGVGCDQLILVEAPQDGKADIFMRIYNPDGSEVEACGNATRCLASLVMQEEGAESCVIETVAGLLHCRAANDAKTMVRVDMGEPRLDWQAIPLSSEQDTLALPLEGVPAAVNIGNPHCVFFVEAVEELDIAAIGPDIETDPLFPQKTNVEFAEILQPDKIRMRVWERGAGITQACGTGACATIVAAVRKGLSEREAEIILDGGSLYLKWDEDYNRLTMTGPATAVYEGKISLQDSQGAYS